MFRAHLFMSCNKLHGGVGELQLEACSKTDCCVRGWGGAAMSPGRLEAHQSSEDLKEGGSRRSLEETPSLFMWVKLELR